jgi:hypothetical protein
LDASKSTGIDEIPACFLKDSSDVICDPLLHIVNLSILSESVPSSLKKARVVPIFKKGSRLDMGNYRPVSVLCVVSKILERAVHGQIMEYLGKHNLLFDYQSGFRGQFSTDSCLINLTDFLKSEISKGRYVGMVLIDLQKAFDTVNHGLLCQKLSAMGIESVDWFRSYLTSREQCVSVGGATSGFMDVNCGVPQGSILGPILFLIYINDMSLSLRCRLSLYADDSALIFSGKDSRSVAEFLSEEMESCHKWLVDNRLSLHLGKTECVLFGTKRRLRRVGDFQVTCNGINIKRVTSVKYLGIYLEDCLSGSVQAQSVIKDCRFRLSFLYRCGGLLNARLKQILCSALLQPRLDYCCSSWFHGLSLKHISALEVIQRRMVRYVFGMGPRDHVDSSHFRSLSWFSVKDRVRYFSLLHVFKIRNGLAPSYLGEGFTSLSSVHNHNTRGSELNFYVPKCVALSPMSQSFLAKSIQYWNLLPPRLKSIDALGSFKGALKSYLLDSY